MNPPTIEASTGAASARGETAEQPGLISSHALPLPARFSFDRYGVRFDAAVGRSDGPGARLMVTCQLGYLPFSAESHVLRRYFHALVDAGTGLPMAEITLDRRQALWLRGEMSFPGTPSPAFVAAGTAAIALSVKPVVELIALGRQAKADAGQEVD